jgi:N-acetylglutamate synthase-like GNAT family acetyltransferase
MIEEILNNKYHDCLTGLDIYENKSSIVVPRIVVKEECRGNNVGTSIMNDLIAYADSNNQIVALTPSSDFGGNKNRLIQFYKRFGFKHNKGQYKSYEFRETMIRYPKLNENTMKKDIECNKCGWSWDKDDTEAHDMYVCHKCGNDNTIKENKGGLVKAPTKKEIIEKFKIDSSELDKEIEMGIKIELEHTDSKEMAEKIAMQHLIEMPDYYTRLKKVEKKGEEEWKEKLKESVARELRKLI